jgi:subtilisin-like proprotein convertase family protein
MRPLLYLQSKFNSMKTPSLWFSLPLLVGALAVLPRSPGPRSPQASSPEVTRPPGSSPSAMADKTNGNAPSSVATASVTAVPTVEEVLTGMPDVTEAASETRVLRIRGRRQVMDILTDRVHIRPQNGRGFVKHLPGMKDLKETDTASTLYDLRGVDRADLIAYPNGRTRSDGGKLLITRRVCVKLAEGVTPSVFARNSGAVVAERPMYAEEALVLTYVTATEALEAVDRLRTLPGVLGANIVVAQQHMPDFVPAAQYFSGGGPEYSPRPLTDNVDGWQPPAFLGTILGTSAYQWWGNNLGIGAPPPLFPIPTEPTGFLAGGGPANSVGSRVDLGDFAPVSYNPNNPLFQGELSDMRLPLAWENLGDFDAPVSGRQRKVLIIDDGIQKTPQVHTDLFLALDSNPQRHWNYFNETASPDPVDPVTDSHGTSLAGIVGARIKPTGSRITGVAPGCWFHGVVALKGFVDDFEWADAFAFAPPPASSTQPGGGPPQGNNRGTLKDTDADNDFLDEDRSGTIFFEICLNAQSNLGTQDASDLYPEDWLWKRAIRFSATRGSAFKGVPFFTSAGNGGDGHMNLNYMELKNSIFQIPVGGVSELGRRIAYSVPGAPLVCVAPTWGQELPPYLNWPSAPPGWPSARPVRKNAPIEPDDLPLQWRRITQGVPTIRTGNTIDFNFNGTSASAAMAAGVAALMLEVNPLLQARDIKEILMRSSRVCGDVRVDIGPSRSPADDDIHPTQWRMAPMGHPMHNAFGAGLIDPDKAIKIAKVWKPLPVNPLPPIKRDVTADNFGDTVAIRNTETGGLYFPVMTSQLIPTDGRAIDIIIPSPPAGMRVEHIEIRVQFYHKRRGDLEIKLVAPGEAGWEEGRELESDLFVPHREDYNEDRWHSTETALRDVQDWTFSTVRHWGTLTEANNGGVWKVRVRDAVDRGVTNTTSANDPVFVPVPNPTDGQSQRIAGVGVTYHGIYGKAISNSAPEVITGGLRFEPSSQIRTAQLNVAELGRDPGTGQIIYPVTSWDFWKGSNNRASDDVPVPTYVPVQPTPPPVDYLEFFPPQARDAVDPTIHLPISFLGLPWPRQPISPMWISFLLDPAARPATWPAPPTSGAVGALTQRPRWVELTPDELWLVIRDERNNNPATNFIHVRLNRATGLLEVIPHNKGKYLISTYAENLLGLSKPKEIEITITPPGYDAWADIFWDPPILTSPAYLGEESGWLGDPDGDGLRNGLEYALRLNPLVNDRGPIPAYRIEGDEIVFSWTQDQSAVDAKLIPQVSEDARVWAEIVPTQLGTDNGLTDYEYRLPLVGDPRLFFRLWSDYNKNAGNP